jgi:hypothetical protein
MRQIHILNRVRYVMVLCRYIKACGYKFYLPFLFAVLTKMV